MFSCVCCTRQAHYLLEKREVKKLVKLKVMNARETGLWCPDVPCTIMLEASAREAAHTRWGEAEGLAAEIESRRARAEQVYNARVAERKETGYQPGQRSINAPSILMLASHLTLVNETQISGRLGGPKYGHHLRSVRGSGFVTPCFSGTGAIDDVSDG